MTVPVALMLGVGLVDLQHALIVLPGGILAQMDQLRALRVQLRHIQMFHLLHFVMHASQRTPPTPARIPATSACALLAPCSTAASARAQTQHTVW